MLGIALMFTWVLGGSAHAQVPFDLRTLLDDTAVPEPEPPPPAALWPASTVVDTLNKTFTIDWVGPEPDETLPFSAVLQIERARAYELSPDELFAVFSDGRRVTLARGDAVAQHLDLIRAQLADRMVELPVGEGHSSQPEGASADPQFSVTVGGLNLALRTQSTEIAPPETQATAGEGQCDDCTDRRDVSKLMRARMGEIRQCYTRQLRRYPNLAGQITVRFVISIDGSVDSATIPQSSMDNKEIEDCVRKEVMQIRFPRPPNNQVMTVNYPLMFSAG